MGFLYKYLFLFYYLSGCEHIFMFIFIVKKENFLFVNDKFKELNASWRGF